MGYGVPEVQARSNGNGSGQVDDEQLVAMLRGLLVAATGRQNPVIATTSVAISVQGEGGQPVPWAVVALERERVAIEPGAGSAEAELIFPPASLRAFVRGDLQLSLAIARGEVAFRGPVRTFLRIAPVLRAIARAERGDAPERP